MPHKSIEGYPSVTEILGVIRKPALELWRGKYGNKKCEKISEQAKTFGTRVHDEIQRLLEGRKPKSKNKIIRAMVDTFNEKFIKEYSVQQLVVEPKEPLIDNELGYSGTFDAVVKCQGSIVLADWKTNKYPDHKSWILQLSAYANLWNKHSLDTPVVNGLVVQLNKKNPEKLYVYFYKDLDKTFPIFVACKKLRDYICSH